MGAKQTSLVQFQGATIEAGGSVAVYIVDHVAYGTCELNAAVSVSIRGRKSISANFSPSVRCYGFGYVAPESTSVREIRTERNRVKVTGDFGEGWNWYRTFHCPTGNVPDALSGILALGAPMLPAYTDRDISWNVDGPRLQSIRETGQVGRGAKILSAVYRSIDVDNVDPGYNETNRWEPAGEHGWMGDVLMTAGIAANRDAANIPQKGDYLDGDSSSVRNYKCADVQIDDNPHGRVIVYSTWIKHYDDTTWEPF